MGRISLGLHLTWLCNCLPGRNETNQFQRAATIEFGSLEEQINEEAEPLSAPPEIKDKKNKDEQSEDMKLNG